VSDKVFESLIVTQSYDMIMNEMINKFETMILFLQTATKKIDSSMQNMTAFISSFNVYILQELDVFSHLIMSMLTQFLHQITE